MEGGEGVIYAILILAVIICGIGWLVMYVVSAALLLYMQERDIPFPPREDVRRGCGEVVKYLFRGSAVRKNGR